MKSSIVELLKREGCENELGACSEDGPQCLPCRAELEWGLMTEMFTEYGDMQSRVLAFIREEVKRAAARDRLAKALNKAWENVGA